MRPLFLMLDENVHVHHKIHCMRRSARVYGRDLVNESEGVEYYLWNYLKELASEPKDMVIELNERVSDYDQMLTDFDKHVDVFEK